VAENNGENSRMRYGVNDAWMIIGRMAHNPQQMPVSRIEMRWLYRIFTEFAFYEASRCFGL